MWSKLGRGWSMARASFSVLRRDPKLMVLPLISASVFGVVIGLVVLSLLPQFISVYGVTGRIWAWLGQAGSGQTLFFIALFAVIYALVALAIFCNVALIACALRSLEGETPSLRAGLATATMRLPQILGWALIASTTGLALKAIQGFFRNFGFIGEFIGNLFEFGWAVATYFVLPVLVTENVGPIAAIRRSSAILRGKWGESAAGEGRFGLLGVLFGFIAVGIFMLGLAIRQQDAPGAMAPLAPVLMGFGIGVGVATTVVLQTLSAIFQAGVYVYATTGRVPAVLDSDVIDAAFRRKG